MYIKTLIITTELGALISILLRRPESEKQERKESTASVRVKKSPPKTSVVSKFNFGLSLHPYLIFIRFSNLNLIIISIIYRDTNPMNNFQIVSECNQCSLSDT